MRKRIVAPAVLALAMTSMVYPTAANANTPTNSNECKAIHIVAANGTGASNSNDNPNYMVDPLAEDVLKAYPNDVNGYTIPYPSSAGAVGSFVAVKSKNSTTYGDSRLLGAEKGLKHIEEYRSNCPNSAIMLSGYSQGASVAGDIAAAISNGAVENTTSDNIFGVFLMADPGRSGNSKYNGPAKDNKTWFNLPEGLKYQRNGELSTPTQDGYVGWTGQRSLPFTGLEGRVISLCSNEDLACSAAINGILRQIADISDKNITPNEAYRNGPTGLQLLGEHPEIFNNVLRESKLGETLASGGTVKQATSNARKYLAKSNMDDRYKHYLNNLFIEVEQMMDILHQDNAFGDKVSDAQILAAFLKNGAPEAVDQLPIAKEQKLAVQAVAGLITSKAPKLPADVKKRTDPIVNRTVQFPIEHGSYFNKHQFNGQNTLSWGKELAKQGVANYLAGNSFVFKADPNNNGNIEIAEENREDDGLQGLVNHEKREVKPNGKLESADDIKDDKTTPTRTTPTSTTPTSTTPVVSDPVDEEDDITTSSSRTRSSDTTSSEKPSSKEDPTTTEESEESSTSSSTTPTTASFTGDDVKVDTGGKVIPNIVNKIRTIF